MLGALLEKANVPYAIFERTSVVKPLGKIPHTPLCHFVFYTFVFLARVRLTGVVQQTIITDHVVSNVPNPSVIYLFWNY